MVEKRPPEGDVVDQAQGPLAGVRVIDMAIGPLAAIGRMLVELGADVIRVEPRAGGVDRNVGPQVAGVGLRYVAGNLGKRSRALDLEVAADAAEFEDLLADADILVETTEPGSIQSSTLNAKAICSRWPSLVILSASAFGANGAQSRWQATSPVLHALSGELSRSGTPGRAPLVPPGDLAFDVAAPQAVFVALVAYFNRFRSGIGDHLDFSVLDAASQALDPGFGIAGSATAGVPASELPRGRPEAAHQYPIIRCADGHVRLCVLSPRQWQGLFEWLGRPAEFADPSFNNTQNRFASPTLIPFIARFFADKTRSDLEHEGQRRSVPIAAVLNVDETVVSEHIRERRAFAPVNLAPGLSAQFPNGVFEIDGRRTSLRGPAPLLDSHAHQGFEPVDGDGPEPVSAPDRRPLSGLRVLDLGVIVVGAELGRLLADQGAEVIKVETTDFPDGARQNRRGGDISVTFCAGNRNKLGLGINLRTPRGKALFVKLVEQSDVLLSNFKPGTLESLGLNYAELRRINPRLIMADSSAFGSTGPWSRRLGYGPLVRAVAGLTAQWRYPDETDRFSDTVTVYPDHVAGRVGAVGVLSLLIRRMRTGHGGTVSVSQLEVILGNMAAQIAAGTLVEFGISAHVTEAADTPWGVFPCLGDDQWCVVTIRNDADWRALCDVMARGDLAADAGLLDGAGRRAARERIERAVCDWLANRTPIEAMDQLQSAGVPAGAMLRVSEMPQFSYFRDRGFFRETRHPLLASPFYSEVAPVRSARLPDPPDQPAPIVGQHTLQIARDFLGLDEAEIATLLEAGVLEAPRDQWADAKRPDGSRAK